MARPQEGSLSPEIVLGEMKKNGVTHVIWLPDSETNWLYLLMKAEPSLTLVGVNREGLALALPHERIVLFDSQGDVQMGMGILATVAELRPGNFYHFMLDNECYATTGGQPVPHARNIAYDAIARAGIRAPEFR